MSGIARRAALFAALALGFCPAASPAAEAPHRIVSLNPCLDAVLVAVADRSQIAALSHYSRDPQASGISDIARTLPFTYESAEEIVALQPDLVLATQHSGLATREALARIGVEANIFPVSNSVAQNLVEIRRVSALVGHPERGEALIGRIEAALAAAAPLPNSPPLTALIFQPNGFAAGEGTLPDEMLRRSGFVNVAARYGLKQWGTVSLEQLLADPPQILLSGEAAPGTSSWGERMITHPALAAIAGTMRRATFPERLLYCGGPALIETAGVLAAARQAAAAAGL